MKDLSYTQILPTKKKISHEESLVNKVKSGLMEILREESGISEKSFSEYQRVIDEVNNRFDDSMTNYSINEYRNGKRIGYICELIYDQYFKSGQIKESKIFKFGDF
jgi:hypothetical protein